MCLLMSLTVSLLMLVLGLILLLLAAGGTESLPGKKTLP